MDEQQAKDEGGVLCAVPDYVPVKWPRIWTKRIHSTNVPYKVLIGERVMGVFPSLEEAREEAMLYSRSRVRIAYVKAYRNKNGDLTDVDVFIYKRLFTTQYKQDLYYAKIRFAVQDPRGHWHWCFMTVEIPQHKKKDWIITLPHTKEKVEVSAWRFVRGYALLNARHKMKNYPTPRKNQTCRTCWEFPCECHLP